MVRHRNRCRAPLISGPVVETAPGCNNPSGSFSMRAGRLNRILRKGWPMGHENMFTRREALQGIAGVAAAAMLPMNAEAKRNEAAAPGRPMRRAKTACCRSTMAGASIAAMRPAPTRPASTTPPGGPSTCPTTGPSKIFPRTRTKAAARNGPAASRRCAPARSTCTRAKARWPPAGPSAASAGIARRLPSQSFRRVARPSSASRAST